MSYYVCINKRPLGNNEDPLPHSGISVCKEVNVSGIPIHYTYVKVLSHRNFYRMVWFYRYSVMHGYIKH